MIEPESSQKCDLNLGWPSMTIFNVLSIVKSYKLFETEILTFVLPQKIEIR